MQLNAETSLTGHVSAAISNAFMNMVSTYLQYVIRTICSLSVFSTAYCKGPDTPDAIRQHDAIF